MTFTPSLRLVSALLLATLGTATSAEQLQLRILETTDVHMNLLSYDYYQDKPTDQYGLARTISLIKAARGEAPNSLLFDNGDLLQGNPLGDVVARVAPLQPGQTHPAYKVMNPMGYDAANLGNHEFNYGLDFLRRAIAGAGFPYVNSNVLLADGKQDSATPTQAFTPYVLLDRKFKDASGKEHALRVGVIGFVPPQILQWDKANLEGKVVTRDMVDMAKRYVPEMRAKGAQLVVAIPHSGFEKGEVGSFAENAVSRLAEVPGVDAILFGHAHAEFPGKAFASYPKVDIERGTINGVPAVMPGRWGDHLGVIDLTLDNSSGSWKVVGSQASIRPIFDRAAKKSLAQEDPLVMQQIAAEHQRTLDYVRNKVAVSSAPIYSYFAQVADDPSIQIVSNAQIAYVKRAMQGTDYEKYPVLSAAAPFKAGGRQGWTYYTDIPAGPLAIKHMADLYIYPNTLKAMLITGAEVREWLEMSAGQFLRIDPKGPTRQPLINDAFPSYNFDVIDGVEYEIDVSQPARYDAKGQLANADAHRIRNLRFAGQPIVDSARFVVATNNYRAYGGGNFPGLKADKVVLDAPDENRQALVEYLRMSDKLSADHTVNPSADGNWRIARIPGVHPTFLSGSAATRFLAQHAEIGLVQDNGDGSALYELKD
ncbi:bifunctional 2',3'-cyclic-nucleotide 2'-phosphodiesterase/3'-nucleotidase [uncultured Rhodoferax sp.]|uniref:bifunctional 2',3'-cyclic-nucleotide 2'-phosphodiesterase/3'-nucleotidase n=1 Tax=uncultured Rhodoferax sp. TaxID=223188 RepID=UPI0025F92D74|nr:bifunctional 2',3'-cyclic-nucleotide 2'-phosphodiesterase/3'-nucleotidase [uncultured Rhodoferax sp.]